MGEFCPDADDPYDVFGLDRDASREEIRIITKKAKQQFNPDRYPEDEKPTARENFYKIQEAEQEILDGFESEFESESDDIHIDCRADRIEAGDTVEFLVCDEVGDPVEGVTVTVSGSGIESITDEQGQVTLTLDEAGPATVHAHAEGDTTREDRVTVDVVSPVVVDLEVPSERVTGEPVSVVVTSRDGVPIEGLPVEVVSEQRRDDTDEEGRATFTFETQGEYSFTVDTSGEPYEFDSGHPTVDVKPRTVDPDIGVSDRGKVGDVVAFKVEVEGEAVTDATVVFDGESKETGLGGVVEFTPERAGNIPLEVSVPDDDQRLVTSYEAEISINPATVELSVDAEETTVPEGDPVDVTIEADVDTEVDGIELAAEPVGLSDETVTETQTGTTEVAFSSPGTTTLIAEAPDDDQYEFLRATEQFQVRPDGVAVNIDTDGQRIETASPFEVTVRDGRGNALPGAEVSLEQSGEPVDSAEADDSGLATLSSDRYGDHRILATYDGGTSVTTGRTTVTVENDEPPELSVVGYEEEEKEPKLRHDEPVECRVEGSETSRPLDGITVRAENQAGDGETIRKETTDGTVSFDCDGGRWILQARRRNGSKQLVSSEVPIVVERNDPIAGYTEEPSIDRRTVESILETLFSFGMLVGIGGAVLSMYFASFGTLWTLASTFLFVVSLGLYYKLVA